MQGLQRRPNLFAMTARERLYELVEDLDQEAVERLVARWDEVLFLASDWEPDDRPLTPDEEAAVREGLSDLAAGRTVSIDELKRRYLPAEPR
jgi:PHD/YefM family antitoxin component YafN of YafNO toxin-antitoxin module